MGVTNNKRDLIAIRKGSTRGKNSNSIMISMEAQTLPNDITATNSRNHRISSKNANVLIAIKGKVKFA
jgi:hypothetical protein